jgi:hypothetical protein
MEPKLPAPNPESGRASFEYGQSTEVLPVPPTPERGLERDEKPMEQRGEARPSVSAMPPVLPTPVIIPAPSTNTDDATQAAMTDDGTLVAKDDDLIEKEWVDKAKRIITETKDDPHRREREVGKLQADYLRKRYGKELGASD